MTGIERLREFVDGVSPITAVCGVTKLAYDREHMEAGGVRLRDFLADIAEQIKREHAEDCFRMGERAADVSMSAYDLLPADEREAIAWVRERGGLEHLKSSLSAFEMLAEGIEIDTGLAFYDESPKERCVALRNEVKSRLMPEGMEWLVEAWPRFEDDAPLCIGDEISWKDDGGKVNSIELQDGGYFILHAADGAEDWIHPQYFPGERVKRPAPKVLDADGVEIREKGDVWWICEGDDRGIHAERLRVETIGPNGLIECSPYNGGTWVYLEPSELYVNKPVLAADGRPLREGEKPYRVDNGKQVEIRRIDPSNGESCVFVGVDGRSYGYWLRPGQLTHELPESWERLEEDAKKPTCEYFGHQLGDGQCETCHAYTDSTPQGGRGCRYAQMADLVRRAKALAERDA